ncbi:MAG: hypothetical protein VXY05_07125 [Pseudomonadota bacterium]|nr:hypothetical protein [Pseudomonadota bacterium]
MPNEKLVFTRASILFRPQKSANPADFEIGGGAGYRPRVRIVYSTSRLSP